MFSYRLIKTLLITIIISTSLFAQEVKIKIIETTDTHGKVFPYDFKNNKPSEGSLAQVYTYVQKERADKSQNVLLFSAGDVLQGTPFVYYYNYESVNNTHPYAEVLNYMKYDAGTVGNHDIETGHNVYDKYKTELNFPWLAANAVDVKTGKPYFEPYTVFEKEGVKIAVLGLITPGVPRWLPEVLWEGIRFDDMIQSAERWVKIIKDKESPDIMIGLFHSGVDHSYDNVNNTVYMNENASQLVAEKVDGFDVVFVGHDHAGWNKKIKNNFGNDVLILGATSAGREVAVADFCLEYDKENKSWIKSVVGSRVSMKGVEPDATLIQNFKQQFVETKDYVSKPIGELTETIDSKKSLFSDASFVDLIHKIQLELTSADVSFTAPLSINSEIEKGTLTVGDMFKLYKYENFLYTMELTGKEIKDFLTYSYSLWFNNMKSENDNLLQFEYDENGELVYSQRSKTTMLKNRYYNFDSAEGIDYIVNVAGENGIEVVITGFSNGNTFQLDKKYKVAINSYRGNGGGGHLSNGAGIKSNQISKRIINSTDKDLRFYLMKWIEKNKIIKPDVTNNWKVIPEDWYEKSKQKDYNLLFGINNE